jgi:iron complex outermembrane receptor protein
VNSKRKDIGASAMLYYRVKNHSLSFGFDFKSGSVYGIDEYQTSTDKVINQGVLDVYNLYLTDEWKITKKLKIIIALHYAYGDLYKAAFTLEDYTNATDYMLGNTGDLNDKKWSGFSPRIALQYDFSKNSNIYTVYSHGYRAPTLDDVTRYGFINIGYKNANPNLLPEKINNIELGYRLQQEKWELQTNAYFSQGDDFMYYVATGETMFGGRKKVYQKENINLVNMYGAEFNVNYFFVKHFRINVNYTLNFSEIVSFNENPNLEGKRLSFVPIDIANFSMNYNYKKFFPSVNIHYQGEMFLDEENAFSVEPLMGLDINLRYVLFKKLSVELGVQNVFDEQHLVSTDQVSLGRFIKFGLKCGIGN